MMYYLDDDALDVYDLIIKPLKEDKVYEAKFHTGGIVGTTQALNGLGAACKSGAFSINEIKQALSVYQELSPIKELKSKCPGLRQVVKMPCSCHSNKSSMLESLLIHLNDTVGWTREEIADWLDSLDIDLEVNL